MNNNQRLEKRKRLAPVTPSRNENVSDLKIICQVGFLDNVKLNVSKIKWNILFKDGVTFAHQFLLGRHSRYLKQLFSPSFSIDNVRLVEPKCPGLERRIKVSFEYFPWDKKFHWIPVLKIDRAIVNNELHLPDFCVKTVSLLLDLLYTGRAETQVNS